MLFSEVENDFSGRLTIWGIKCTFSFSKGFLLTIQPDEDELEAFKSKCMERNGNYDSLGWIHGQCFGEIDVNFLASEQQGSLCYYRGTLTLIVSVVLKAYNIRGHNGKYLYAYKDLNGFSAIDFAGKAVDAVFPPKKAVKEKNYDDRIIEWLPCTEYAKEFETKVLGVTCKLILTTVVDRLDLDMEKTSLGTIHSIIRLEFSERQDLSMIEPCWQAVCTFLTFCVGQYNVTNLEIGLWDEEMTPGILDFFGNIACLVNDDKEEDILPQHPPFCRFQINSLGGKVGTLFELLNDEKRRPILGFLPRTNSDVEVDRNKIRDLCTAFEVEYDYRKDQLSNPSICALVEQLSETVKRFRKENPDLIDDVEYSYICSSISVISRPARKKILSIFNRYKEIIDEKKYLVRVAAAQAALDTSEEATMKDIGWLVKVRNGITHSSGFVDTTIPNMIFIRLKLALFCSVLERGGYSIEEIAEIIDNYCN